MQSWKTDEISFLLNHIQKGTKEIYDLFCEEYGSYRSYDSVQKKTRRLREAFSTFDEENIAGDEIEELIEYANSIAIEPTGSIIIPHKPSASDREKKAKETKAWLEGLIDLIGEIDVQKLREQAKAVQSNESSIVIILSDTHFGKRTKFFNLAVAKQRTLSIASRLAELSLPGFDEIVLILAGDMVEGEDIFPSQNSHIECAAIDQVIACSEAIWELVLLLRTTFNTRIRIETVPGNHGRVSKTANEKTNWDNIVYHLLTVMISMQDDLDIVINCNFEEFITFKIKDKVTMACHYGVKHTGTPAMREKVAGWIASKNFDLMVHGHWHEWHVGNWLGRSVIANGCLCGPDDLSQRMGKEETARQAFFFITPNKPVWGQSFFEWNTHLLVPV